MFNAEMLNLPQKVIACAMLREDYEKLLLIANVLLEGKQADKYLGEELLTLCDRMVPCTKGDKI